MIGIAFMAMVLYTNLAQARVDGTKGKACPDFDSDCCCEIGQGGCPEEVVITYQK